MVVVIAFALSAASLPIAQSANTLTMNMDMDGQPCLTMDNMGHAQSNMNERCADFCRDQGLRHCSNFSAHCCPAAPITASISSSPARVMRTSAKLPKAYPDDNLIIGATFSIFRPPRIG